MGSRRLFQHALLDALGGGSRRKSRTSRGCEESKPACDSQEMEVKEQYLPKRNVSPTLLSTPSPSNSSAEDNDLHNSSQSLDSTALSSPVFRCSEGNEVNSSAFYISTPQAIYTNDAPKDLLVECFTVVSPWVVPHVFGEDECFIKPPVPVEEYETKLIPFQNFISSEEESDSVSHSSDSQGLTEEDMISRDESSLWKDSSNNNSTVRNHRHMIRPRRQYSVSMLQNLETAVGFVDTHCHLDFLFKRTGHCGGHASFQQKMDSYPFSYEGCVTNFCDPDTFKQKSFWEPLIEESGVWAAFGCHPHHAARYTEEIDEALIVALQHKHVRALGEIGLDYSDRNKCDKSQQHLVFRRQLKLAVKHNLPLVIHSRDSDEDCLEIMKEIVPDNHRIHLHCFRNSWTMAEKWMDSFPKLFIGITNCVTYSSATKVHEVVERIPLNRLLLETDAPYFVPSVLPKTTKWSHPGMALHVAAEISAIKRTVTLEEVLHVVRKNTELMYGI